MTACFSFRVRQRILIEGKAGGHRPPLQAFRGASRDFDVALPANRPIVNAETRKHRGTKARKQMFFHRAPLCLCVFVSLCLLSLAPQPEPISVWASTSK